jgi:galactose mutarotase-like enzyme
MNTSSGSLDWTYKGMRTLIMESDLLRISVLLDKGSDIFEVIYKPIDIDVIWHSPNGYKDPKMHLERISRQEDEFTDNYGGGWNDVFPNYGFPSINRGTRFGQHGESALLPWTCKHVESSNGRVTANLSLNCLRYPLRAEKALSLEGSKFTVSEDIQNVGEQEIEFSWGHHIAYGEPFVSQDLQIDIPAVRAVSHDYDMSHERIKRNTEFHWPLAPGLDGREVDLSKIPDRSSRIQEDFPITELRDPSYRLYNPSLDLGVSLSWNSALPYLWYWLNWGILDYPWFGRARTLALEPTTSRDTTGLQDQIRHGTAVTLPEGKSLHGEVTMELFRKTNIGSQQK